MVFKLRVTLSGIKGFYRVYHVHGATTLYTLHKQLRSDLEFPQDQLIMFKGLDFEGAVVGRWGLFDLGNGTVDQAHDEHNELCHGVLEALPDRLEDGVNFCWIDFKGGAHAYGCWLPDLYNCMRVFFKQ